MASIRNAVIWRTGSIFTGFMLHLAALNALLFRLHSKRQYNHRLPDRGPQTSFETEA